MQGGKPLAVAAAVYIKTYGTTRIRGIKFVKKQKDLFERSYYHISVVGLSCFLLPSIVSMIFLIPVINIKVKIKITKE